MSSIDNVWRPQDKRGKKQENDKNNEIRVKIFTFSLGIVLPPVEKEISA